MRRAIPLIAGLIVIAGIAVFLYMRYASDPGITAEPGVGNPFESVGENWETEGEASALGEGEGSADPDATWGEIGEPDEVTPRLVMITPGPVAQGALAMRRPDAASTTDLGTGANRFAGVEVRYAMRGSGNIFSYLADEGRSVRLSNKTVPGIQDASWIPNGSRAYLRFLATDADGTDHVDTYGLVTDGIEGGFLARDIASIDTNASSVLTLVRTTGGTTATIMAGDGTGARTVFTSPISGLRAEFAGANILATTKPSRSLPGYAFSVSGTTGSFARILGPYTGLSAIASPDGTGTLFSYVDGSALRLAFHSSIDQSVTPLPVQTLADKCAFAPDGAAAYCAVPSSISVATLPDAWYQGTVAFADRIWKIDFAARVATLAVDLPQLASEPVDAVALSTNPEGTALVFTNRRDGSLWLYAL